MILAGRSATVRVYAAVSKRYRDFIKVYLPPMGMPDGNEAIRNCVLSVIAAKVPGKGWRCARADPPEKKSKRNRSAAGGERERREMKMRRRTRDGKYSSGRSGAARVTLNFANPAQVCAERAVSPSYETN